MKTSTHPFLVPALALLLALSTIVAFWPVTGSEFVAFDDDDYITKNPIVLQGLTWEGVRWAFTATHAHNWHPLTWLSHMMDASLLGSYAPGHHAVNLLFHAINTLLLFLILVRMTGAPWRSAFAAALFGLHPLHVESVAWAAERKDVLSAMFWMLAIGSYALYAERKERRFYGLSLALFALGLLAKPMLVTLPFVLLLLDHWPLQRLTKAEKTATTELPHQQEAKAKKGRKVRSAATHRPPVPSAAVPAETWRGLILEKIPFLALTAAASIVTLYAQQGVVKSLEKYPFAARLGNAVVSYAEYLVKTVWPVDLSIFYPHPVGSLAAWKILLAAAAILAVTAAALHVWRRFPYLAVGWFWYLGTLVPVIGIVQVGLQSMADRYTYIPLIGIFIIAAWGVSDLLARFRHRRETLAGAAAIVLIVLAVLTFRQTGVWRNSLTLFRHAVEVTENNDWAQYNYGLALLEKDDTEAALDHFREALRIRPGEAKSLNNIGLILARRGDLDGAVRNFEAALTSDPGFVDARTNLALALSNRGQPEEAARQLEESLRIQPTHAEANRLLGVLLARAGNTDRAIVHLRNAVSADPSSARVRNSLGIVLAQKGMLDEAITHFRAALALDPSLDQARRNLETALQEKQK